MGATEFDIGIFSDRKRKLHDIILRYAPMIFPVCTCGNLSWITKGSLLVNESKHILMLMVSAISAFCIECWSPTASTGPKPASHEVP